MPTKSIGSSKMGSGVSVGARVGRGVFGACVSAGALAQAAASSDLQGTFYCVLDSILFKLSAMLSMTLFTPAYFTGLIEVRAKNRQ
jgi:hypothetical protein